MKNGNRLSETRNASVLPYTYSPAGSNWLYQKGSDIRSKTANGNTAAMSTASFTYDGYNRLATSTTASETTTYTYNALGERTKKRNQNGLQTVFHYGNNGELLWEKDQAGNTKAYVWLDGRPLARIDNDATIYYYHVDHLGTPQAMTDAAGAVVWKADYEPFGKAAMRVETVQNNLRLPGQYFDRETGLYYNYFRDYDPTTGRYVEADPIGLDGGVNLYLYANAAPTMYIDPMGLCPWCLGFVIGAAADVAIQVGSGINDGQSFQDALSNVNLTQAAISGAATAVGAGAVSVAADFYKSANLFKAPFEALTAAQRRQAGDLFARAQAAQPLLWQRNV